MTLVARGYYKVQPTLQKHTRKTHKYNNEHFSCLPISNKNVKITVELNVGALLILHTFV